MVLPSFKSGMDRDAHRWTMWQILPLTAFDMHMRENSMHSRTRCHIGDCSQLPNMPQRLQSNPSLYRLCSCTHPVSARARTNAASTSVLSPV